MTFNIFGYILAESFLKTKMVKIQISNAELWTPKNPKRAKNELPQGTTDFSAQQNFESQRSKNANFDTKSVNQAEKLKFSKSPL